MVAEGCIHGWFQPFHNGHLAYAREALERCGFLWIGLSEPFPPGSAGEERGHHPGSPAHPLTYHERQHMITRTLIAEGVLPERFSFTPFPIRTPGVLPHFLSPEVTCFVTAGNDAHRGASRLLDEVGFPVEPLPEGGTGITSAEICARLRDGDDSWRDLVPFSVAGFLSEIDLAARLRDTGG